MDADLQTPDKCLNLLVMLSAAGQAQAHSLRSSTEAGWVVAAAAAGWAVAAAEVAEVEAKMKMRTRRRRHSSVVTGMAAGMAARLYSSLLGRAAAAVIQAASRLTSLM